MQINDLVFIGIKGTVIALNRASGVQVWATHLKSSDFVNVVLQAETKRIYATTSGEIFCLDALTGNGVWENRLKGFGTGLATIAVADATSSAPPLLMAEQRRRQQAQQAATVAPATT